MNQKFKIAIAGLLLIGIGVYPAFSVTYPKVGGPVASADMPDPYVPVDGTMNVTGAFVASGNIAASGASSVAMGDVGGITGFWANTGSVNNLNSWVPDGATAVAWKIFAKDDYTTAGAKILSIGDNAGATYAEKLAIDLDGDLVPADGTMNVTGALDSTSYGQFASVTVGSNSVTYPFIDGNSSSALVLGPQPTYGVDINTSGSKVACASGNQGSLFYENTDGDSTTATLYMCMESAGNTFSWRSVATGG